MSDDINNTYYNLQMTKITNKAYLLLFTFLFLTVDIFADDALKVNFKTGKVEMDNGAMLLTFQNDKTFRLLSFADKGKSWTFNDDVLWQLSMIAKQGERLTVNSQNATYKGATLAKTGDTKSLIFTWEYPLDNKLIGKVFMTVTITNKNSLTEWSIASEFPEIWSVASLNFPMVNIPKKPTAKLIMPSGWGVEYNLADIKNTTFANVYPSSRATVQLMSVYEHNHVFYFATHDAKASLKTFSAKVTDAHVELSNKITTAENWNNKGLFKLPWKASLGITDQGWENAVINWYRPFSYETAWGKKKFSEKKYPEWLLNSDLWLTGGHTTPEELGITNKAITFFGKQTSFHWYYWHHAPFDTKYPEYLPAKEGFKDIIKLTQSKGSHIMPYINGRLWDTTTVSYREKRGDLAVVLKQDLTPLVEVYASKAPNAVICPSSAQWSAIMVDLTERIQGGNLGTDGLYFDQVASARALPCYNASHGHPVGGGSFWYETYLQLFKKVRAVLKPGQIISTEQNAEPYLDMFDLFLMVNYPQGKEYNPVPLYSLIYADRALLYGFYIYNKNDSSFRLKNALTLLWGAQLNGGRTSFVLADAMKSNAQFLLDLATFRKSQHDLFNGGQLMKEIHPLGDNPTLTIPNWGSTSAAVRGALWKSKEGKYAVLLVNIDNVKHDVTIPYTNKMITLKAGESIRINVQKP
jgi:hypothetical protein